jgi:hypothetical protein
MESSASSSSSPPSRLAATVVIWAMLMAGMVILSTQLAPFVGAGVMFILVLFTLVGLVLSGFIWNWGRLSSQETSSEALKRNRLTLALRDLSDDELKRLRLRLSNGDIDDEQLGRLLDESEASKAKRY